MDHMPTIQNGQEQPNNGTPTDTNSQDNTHTPEASHYAAIGPQKCDLAVVQDKEIKTASYCCVRGPQRGYEQMP